MFSVQNISDVVETIQFEKGHQNWHEISTFTGDYPMAQFERSHLEKFSSNPRKRN